MKALWIIAAIVWAPVVAYTIWTVFISPVVWILKDRRLRKRPVLMTTPLGKVRCGMDSPDLLKEYRPWA